MSTSIVHSIATQGALTHRILLVDDDQDYVSEQKSLLEEHGFQVYTAKDGGQAHSIFEMRKPDFVILDLILPGESGFEICERMKQIDRTIPVLIATAIDLEDSRNLAQRVGADGYLTKPVEPDELFKSVERISEDVWRKVHSIDKKTEERIRFSCRCGKKFKVSAQHRGRSLTCPSCGEPISVPYHN